MAPGGLIRDGELFERRERVKLGRAGFFHEIEERARKVAALPPYRPWFYNLVRGSSAVILHTFFRLSVDGLENVPPMWLARM